MRTSQLLTITCNISLPPYLLFSATEGAEQSSPKTDAPTKVATSNTPDNEVETVPTTPSNENEVDSEVEENEAEIIETKSKKHSKSKSRSKTKGRGRSKSIRKSGRGRNQADAPAQAQQTGGKGKNTETAVKSSVQSTDNWSIEELINFFSSLFTSANN